MRTFFYKKNHQIAVRIIHGFYCLETTKRVKVRRSVAWGGKRASLFMTHLKLTWQILWKCPSNANFPSPAARRTGGPRGERASLFTTHLKLTWQILWKHPSNTNFPSPATQHTGSPSSSCKMIELRSTRRRSNSPMPTHRRIKLSRDVGELVLNPIQLIRS